MAFKRRYFSSKGLEAQLTRCGKNTALVLPAVFPTLRERVHHPRQGLVLADRQAVFPAPAAGASRVSWPACFSHWLV